MHFGGNGATSGPESTVVISTCKFCRGCAMHFGRNGATSGMGSDFCIMITHRAAHRLLCSNSSPRKAFLSSPNHRTLRISLRVTFKMGLKGTRFAIMEDIKWNGTAELRKIPKEAFRRCFQQWQDRWSKCVCAQGSYFEGD